MKWTIFLLVALLHVAFSVIQDARNEASTESSGSGGAQGGGDLANEDDTQGQLVSVGRTATATKTSTSDPSGEASASAGASISQKPNPPRTTTPPIPTVSTDNLETAQTTSTKTSTTTSTTTTPEPTTTPPPTPPPKKCDICELPDFMGFGFKPGKCGCCPWPCCCKCVGAPGGGSDVGPCRALLDLAFILDDSGSISRTDWEVAKQFFYNVVSMFVDIGGDQHVASVTFSSNATVNWGFSDTETSSAEALKEAIFALVRTAGFTNTAEAIEKTTNEVFTAPHDNPRASNVAVFMTDGRANFRKNEIADLAKKLRQKASTVCIGVTNQVDINELRMLCDEDMIFSVNDFDQLSSILKRLQSEICPTPPTAEKCFCCCTPEQFWGAGGAHYYGRGW